MTDKEKFEKEAFAEFLEMTGIPKERIDQYERVHRVEFPTYGETYELKDPGLAVLFKSNSPEGLWPILYFPKKPQGISEPVISHSETSGLIYVYFGEEKYEITKYAIEAVEAIKALEHEPTTKNCRTCKNFGSHHGVCEICKDNKCWTEQESFINKPCVSEKVCEHDKNVVLDKIRAEIIDTGAYEQETHGKTEFLEGINYCLGVINKYISGKEQKDEQE